MEHLRCRGRMTLGPGNYRTEFYVDDVLVDTVKLKIVK